MARDEAWLKYGWAFVRASLPAPPAEVLEIGSGTAGGFIPALLSDGYTATGVDPEAPAGPAYRSGEFEGYDPPRPLDAVVASTSLHHVADLEVALNRLAAVLRPGGTAVIIEWASELFDEQTARWCFARLPAASQAHDHAHDHAHGDGWLSNGREAWLESGKPWQEFRDDWRATEGLHAGGDVLRALDGRFDRLSCTYGPYFFPDLHETTEADEQAAIDAGQIQAVGIRYVGTLRSA